MFHIFVSTPVHISQHTSVLQVLGFPFVGVHVHSMYLCTTLYMHTYALVYACV